VNVNQRTDDSIAVSVLAAVRSGVSNSQAARDHDISEATVRRMKARSTGFDSNQEVVHLDKKVGTFNWRDSIKVVQSLQKLRGDASWSQKTAKIRVGDGSAPIAIMCLSDMHIGSVATDYDLFIKLTDLILNTPGLYVAIVGDEVEWACRLRSVAEVCAQVLDPSLQLEFIEQWLDEILHKVLFSTWSNHSTDRSEQMIGTCPVKNILAKKAPFFSGIGHAEILVGKEIYWMAVSHRFKGVTQTDSTAGCKRYMRVEWTQAEIAMQGDCHRAGVSVYNEGSRNLVAISSGALNVNSSYAARNFSLFTSPAMPIVQLFPDEHLIIPYFTVDHYLKARS
jgi:hypothetical protein